MAVVLLPFALIARAAGVEREIRIGAGLLVLLFGLSRLLLNRRHPRWLARIRPTQLALWSFLMATAHGAGLMLLPIYLGLCAAGELDAAHQASSILMARNATLALGVALVHALAMVMAGGAIALAVHAWLGLRFLTRTWFNLDLVWALSLILIGGISLAMA